MNTYAIYNVVLADLLFLFGCNNPFRPAISMMI